MNSSSTLRQPHKFVLRLFNVVQQGRQHPICTTAQTRTCFDPKRWCEPILDMEELNKLPLPHEDPRHSLFPKPMESWKTPMFYRSHSVDKMIRIMMSGGRDKSLTRTEVYEALELVKRRQYKKWLEEKDEEKKSKIILDPIKVAELAIRNCQPVMELKRIVKVGIIYQVPFPLREEKAIFYATRMMRDICRQKCKHGKNRFREFLANELIGALNNEGYTIQAKQELHRQCEANRAFISFRKF